ncbi:MAG: 4-hydroxy-tetrahydrodipicolinate reductase [Candidatus Sumerlaeia bacterium]|nr:4-hydroxy-tetrahydrodipicolinate reductase [Candidatus Sumerlaeia bacterium]
MKDSTLIPIIVSGILGKMGRTVVGCLSEVSQRQRFELVGGLERPEEPLIGKPLAEIFPQLGVTGILRAEIEQFNVNSAVLIEFCSSPVSAVEHCRQAGQRGWQVVVATTGFNQQQIMEIEQFARQTAIVLSPNLSIGVNILFKLTEQVARLLGDRYDVEIVDIHHRLKRDAPSGTARMLAEILSREIREVTGSGGEIVFGRQPGTPAEKRIGKEIVVHSLRVGDVVGEHTIVFAGSGERLELTHRASSRETFARGALRAAEFIWQKNTGLYTMADVLGL